MALNARLRGLTERILKSKMLNDFLPENDWSLDKRISGGGLYVAVSIQLVHTRRLQCR
jgi:hypothetical protein